MGFLGGVGGLIGALGSNATSTDRGFELTGLRDLANLYQFGSATGKEGEGKGQATEASALSQLGGPAAYYAKILNGGRQGALSAAAPTVNAAGAAADAQKEQIATGGNARGGGVNATGQQIETNKNATIDSAINATRPEAAQGATQVAGQTANIGSTQLQNALQLLGLAKGSAADLANISNDSRNTSNALHQQKAYQIASSIASMLSSVSMGGA